MRRGCDVGGRRWTPVDVSVLEVGESLSCDFGRQVCTGGWISSGGKIRLQEAIQVAPSYLGSS